METPTEAMRDNMVGQEEAHEVIEFLIRRCYELGATKNY